MLPSGDSTASQSLALCACGAGGAGGGGEASTASLQSLRQKLKEAARVWEGRLAAVTERLWGKTAEGGLERTSELFPVKKFLRKEVI